jgi:hypothetical protein
VTRYQPAEILISAGPRFDRDIQLFSACKVNFVLEASAMCADGLYQHRQTIKALISLQMREIKVPKECRYQVDN